MTINKQQFKEAFKMLDNEEDKNSNIIKFERPALGSKVPPGSGNWLAELKVGTAFLSREKSRNSLQAGQLVNLFHIVFRTDRGYTKLVTDTKLELWVDSQRFCMNNELCEILFEPVEDIKPLEEKEEETDV